MLFEGCFSFHVKLPAENVQPSLTCATSECLISLCFSCGATHPTGASQLFSHKNFPFEFGLGKFAFSFSSQMEEKIVSTLFCFVAVQS